MSPRLRHLTTLENLPRDTIERLLDRAEALRDACAHGTRKLDVLAGRTVLNLFFEPSTRTRTSFELAARRLGADVVNFDIGFSSTSKGEELFDTLHTLEAMHLDAIIVRHKQSGTPDELVRTRDERRVGDQRRRRQPRASHAGSARRLDHPPAPTGFRESHRGDLRRHQAFARGAFGHPRADRAGHQGNSRVRPVHADAVSGGISQGSLRRDFDEAIRGADAVITLRLQKERMAATDLPDEAAYFSHYGLDQRRLALAAKGCLVMHPGPINRGIEIASDVADGAQSRILEQVGNGVFVRMAVLNECWRADEPGSRLAATKADVL
jgi:aspartate carbamoyltransferase catalytic subunit